MKLTRLQLTACRKSESQSGPPRYSGNRSIGQCVRRNSSSCCIATTDTVVIWKFAYFALYASLTRNWPVSRVTTFNMQGTDVSVKRCLSRSLPGLLLKLRPELMTEVASILSEWPNCKTVIKILIFMWLPCDCKWLESSKCCTRSPTRIER